MSDTVESLRTELDALRTEFTAFKAYAMPVINAHQPTPPEILAIMPKPPGKIGPPAHVLDVP